jgi:hypothetical protein
MPGGDLIIFGLGFVALYAALAKVMIWLVGGAVGARPPRSSCVDPAASTPDLVQFARERGAL